MRARTGSTPILIYDFSPGGLRIVHAAHIARVGETLLLVIEWQEQTIHLNCEVRRTAMKQAEGESPRSVFESGLLIRFAEEPALAALQNLIDAEARKAHIKKTVSIAVPPG
jgi:hypothetical protein